MSYTLNEDTLNTLPGRAGRGFKAQIFAQPIMSLQTGLLNRFELLARIRDEKSDDPLLNEKIYTELEKSDAIIAHDLDVFRHAHRVLATLAMRMKISDLPVFAVNFSPRTLSSEQFGSALESLARHDPRLMRKLVLEVTERYDFNDLHRARYNLSRAREWGMEISQDDVPEGTCAALRHKETRHMVSTIKLVGEAALGLKQIAGIAFNPGAFKTVREMIETADDMFAARAAGMSYGQGYFFGRPVPLSEALEGWGEFRAG